jgi:hypothetical protein
MFLPLEIANEGSLWWFGRSRTADAPQKAYLNISAKLVLALSTYISSRSKENIVSFKDLTEYFAVLNK